MRPLLALAALAALAEAAPAQSAPPADTAAVAALRQHALDCARDGGRLWGRSLCGRVLLVDPRTRRAVASAADSAGTLAAIGDTFAGDAFAGTLPRDVPLANTSLHWAGGDWAMVLLPLPTDRFARSRLLAHEAFHREQRALGFHPLDPASPHLDERDGRLWLRLELRAWAAALRTTGAASRAHVVDALHFRARRWARYPGADTLEARMELHEGLAEYTGTRVALDAWAPPSGRAADDLAAFERSPTYVRSFAYATGPALGLVLDRLAPGWRARAAATPDLARALAAAARVDPTRESERATWARAARYDGDRVRAEEDARAAERARRLADYRARLVDGPTLLFRQRDLGTSFDPMTLVPLPGQGTVYPTGTFRAAWGTLTVEGGGALVSPDFTELRVSAPIDTTARPVRGAGWTLELAPGWTVRGSGARAGARAGVLEVVRP